MAHVISNDTLFQAILRGAVHTKEKKDILNRINVFPVVDHDTGNNLAHTMQYILTHAEVQDDIRSTLNTIANSALMGARGNSGAIFSQYFNGLYQASTASASITLKELASCFHLAYEKAYKLLENPVEGTILTLMRAWAASIKESLDENHSLQNLFELALSRIKVSLDETKTTLDALKSLDIVDAGALGYYYFMDGFTQGMLGQTNRIETMPRPEIASFMKVNLHSSHEDTEISFRYCTEVLLDSKTLCPDELRKALNPLGDCLVISSTDHLTRAHLHTNRPWEMIQVASAHGNIIEQKADNMVWQNILAGPNEAKIACVTDSIADLPQDFVHKHNVFQIPINIMIDGVNFLDKVTIDGAYMKTHAHLASTAQLNMAQISSFFDPIINHYDKVLILTVSSKMSGTYDRFREYLQDMPEHASRIALIDTKVNSGAQGLLVHKAVAMIEAGNSFSNIVSAIESLRAQAKIVVSVLDIKPMARSGRVSERIGDLLIKLHFKPLVAIDPEGKGTIKGVAFSDKKNWKNLLRSLRGKAIGDYVIVHANAPERAAILKQEMIRLTGRAPLYTAPISAAVVLFAGQGSVAVAYLEKETSK